MAFASALGRSGRTGTTSLAGAKEAGIRGGEEKSRSRSPEEGDDFIHRYPITRTSLESMTDYTEDLT